MENKRTVTDNEVAQAAAVIMEKVSITLNATDLVFPGIKERMIRELIGQLESMLPEKKQAEACTSCVPGPGTEKAGLRDEKKVPVPVYNDLMATASLMSSEDYADRFRAEYYQTKLRYDKLHQMLVKYEGGTLDFTPQCSLELLQRQKHAMSLYIDCLEIRAQIEHIVL